MRHDLRFGTNTISEVIAALESTGWHRGKAAEMLGFSPPPLSAGFAITSSLYPKLSHSIP